MVFYPGVILAFFESGKHLVEKTLEDVCTLKITKIPHATTSVKNLTDEGLCEPHLIQFSFDVAKSQAMP